MKRLITVLIAMVGIVVGSGVFWCLFLLGIEVGLWQMLDIRSRDRITLGPFEFGPLFSVTTIGGLLGLVVGLNVGTRLFKHGGKTGEEVKAEQK